jgi:hypothetical protein
MPTAAHPTPSGGTPLGPARFASEQSEIPHSHQGR